MLAPGNEKRRYLPFRYLPAILSANAGKIINTFIKSNLMSSSPVCESGLSGPDDVRTAKMPITPKVMEAPMKMQVAIFCIVLV